MKREVSEDTAIERLEGLCAVSERCESELREKLWRWEIRGVVADRIIARLRETRFVDDERYARAFVRDKYRLALWGRRKIAMALYAKKIMSATVRRAMEEIDEEEYAASARKVVESKMKSISEPDSYEGKTKVFRYAVSRGYEPDVVARIIRSK